MGGGICHSCLSSKLESPESVTREQITNPPAATSSKQVKINAAIGGHIRVAQGEIDKLMVNFICEGLHPFSLVEQPALKK